MITWSPGLTAVTPGPTALTTPAPSSPRTIGIGAPPTDPSSDVETAVADPARRHPDRDLASLRRVELDLEDAHLGARSVQNRGEHSVSSCDWPGYQMVQPPSMTMSWPVR